MSAQKLTGWAGEVGTKVEVGPWTVLGASYYGHAIAQQYAQLLRYGDISGWGAWGQVGWNFAQHWSAWAFAGRADQHGDDPALKSPENWSISPMARFEWGALDLGAEWLHSTTTYYGADGSDRSVEITRPGNEIAVSTLLHF